MPTRRETRRSVLPGGQNLGAGGIQFRRAGRGALCAPLVCSAGRRADEGIGPYARKRSGCPGGPFAAGGASASSSHRTRGEGPERGRTPCCRGGDKPRPYRGAQNGSPAALHRARRRRRGGCPHPPVRRVAPCPAGPHPQREPQGRRRLAAALDYVDYGGGRFPCDWTNG